MGELRAPVCSGRNPKRRFPNKLAAEIALADIQRAPAKFPKKPTRVYECGICQGWHLTSEPPRAPEPRVEKCRSCGADVIWLKHERTGKPAPIDAGEDVGGNCVMLPGATEYAVLTRQELDMVGLTLSGRPLRPRHTNHFVTCPQAPSWRRASA